jgi:aminoglycoside phosphotransferase (APT) family kinase protein
MEDRDLGQPLARGRTAEIYAWEPSWVVKLYFDWFEPGDVDYERRIASAIAAAGLPVPAVGETVSVAGRAGLLYQRRDGVAMWDDLNQHPARLVSHAQTLAKLHAKMHAKPIQADIPSLRDKLERKLRAAKPLPETLRTAALKGLDEMPSGDRLCHGDFHPGNILLSRPDPVIIDWIDSSIGNPLADVARTTVLALGSANTQSSKFAYCSISATHALYLRRYFQLRPGGRDEYRRWLPIVAAARLSEGITELEPWLLAQAGKLRT